MTTTLRPTGPERSDESGGRERTFAICVNGRQVGGVRVHATPDGVGRIDALSVAERDRGRGRGTTAVLAAEEILRAWGCTRAEGAVAGEEGPQVQRALRWTESLGYALTARNMIKALPVVPPELPVGLTARPLTAEEFTAWCAAERNEYADMLVHRTGRTREQAAAKSAADHAQLLPQGLDTPGVSINHLCAGDEVVGTLWVCTQPTLERPAWVYKVAVRETFRGRGYGRALMLLAERVALAAGRHDLALNVHAGNVPAERLYESLGYRPFRWAVAKQL